jgi:phosphoribosylglycinamide formyltransferase 2
LHARAILGLPIPEIKLERAGASAVVLANKTAEQFTITGIENALQKTNTDVRIFGKPSTRPYRRMAVALVYDTIDADMDLLRKKAKNVADCIKVE